MDDVFLEEGDFWLVIDEFLCTASPDGPRTATIFRNPDDYRAGKYLARGVEY